MPRKSPSRERTLPLEMQRGMWASGDVAVLPPGHARKLRNMQRRSRVHTKRPQLTYDNLTNIRALATWYDSATGVDRLLAINNAQDVYLKSASAETWSAAIAGNLLWDGVNDSANFRGVTFMGVTLSGAPFGAVTFNGVTLSTDTATANDNSDALGEGAFTKIAPYSVATFAERLFIASPRLAISNFLNTTTMYDASAWTRTTVSAANVVVAGGATVSRITPTATTGSMLRSPSAAIGIGAPVNGRTVVWRSDLRGVHESYRMPLTLQILYRALWGAGVTYDVGAVVTPLAAPNDFRYRATVGGVAGGAAPAWPVTVGSTVVDGGVTWVCDGSDVAAQIEITLPNATESDEFSPFECVATFPPIPNSQFVELRIKFGTTAVGTITLASVDFSLKDGLTDGDPRKKNRGQQATLGAFRYPFVNTESAASANVTQDEYVYWTEVGVLRLRAQNYYRATGGGGRVTVVREVGGRLVIFKRNALRVFGAVDDPRLVILPESEQKNGAGCLGPKAFGGPFEDYAYFVGENEIYKWRPGELPIPQCGDAMRDEIMNKAAASWVESQAAPANRALLAIDQRNREMWVYTQKGKLFCKDLDQPAGAGWSVHDAGGGDSLSPVGYQICDMAYNPTTGNMYFAFTTAAAGTAGVARLDPTVTPAQDSISSSGTLPVYAEIWPRAIEASTPAVDVQVDTLRFYHRATADQTGQTMKAGISFDQGVSFTRELTFDLAPLSSGGFVPVELPIFQSWSTVQARLVHVGEGGASNFSVSRVEADIQIQRGNFPKNKVTSSASTL